MRKNHRKLSDPFFWSRDNEEQLLGVVNGLGRDLGVKRESTGTYNPE